MAYWHHLSLSEIIPDSYSGVEAYDPGITFPNSKVSGAGYYLTSGEGINYTGWFDETNLLLFFGYPGTIDYGAPQYPIVTANEAQALDVKTDDGYPFTGNTRIREPRAVNCAEGIDTAARLTNNIYNFAVDGDVCNLIFRLGF